MIRPRILRAAFWVVVVLLLAAPAMARPVVGGGLGSRGSHSLYAPPPTPITPNSAAPLNGGYAPGMRYHHGLGMGLFGGMMGFGLGRALFFPHRGFGFGGGGLLWLLIKLVLLFFLVRWLLRLVFRRSFGPGVAMTTPMGVPAMETALPMTGPALAGQAAGPVLTQADYQAFEILLGNIEAAWSNNDIAALRQFATEAMARAFAEQLAGNARQGLRNIVSDVRLEQGDVAETWHEGGFDYATIAMRYVMQDATYDAAGHVVAGNAMMPVRAAEYWTFVRAPGAPWLLSAIQPAS